MGYKLKIQVSQEEKLARSDKLSGVAGVNQVSILTTAFYKVPFQQALSMVAGRAVYVERGFAFVPMQRLLSIIIFRFRMHLSRALVEAASHFDHVGSDTRIGPLLKVSVTITVDLLRAHPYHPHHPF